MGGGQWHEQFAGLGDLPHYTRHVDDQQTQQPCTDAADAATSDDMRLDVATDGLHEIDIS